MSEQKIGGRTREEWYDLTKHTFSGPERWGLSALLDAAFSAEARVQQTGGGVAGDRGRWH